MRMIIKKAECKDLRGMRYNASWLMRCLALRTKSPKAYEHLRDQKLLPLPDKSTLNRLISGVALKFEFVLHAIGKQLRGKPRHQRKGSLVWDEMSVKKAKKFCRRKLKVEGFVDYGNEIVVEKSDKLADHALVLLFRPYHDRWVIHNNLNSMINPFHFDLISLCPI